MFIKKYIKIEKHYRSQILLRIMFFINLCNFKDNVVVFFIDFEIIRE